MKELREKISRYVQAEQRRSHNQPLRLAEPVQSVSTAIQSLQPQIPQDLPPRANTKWHHLIAQAELINRLAAQLEEAMFELKAIASQVNSVQRHIQVTKKPTKSVCEYVTASVPYIRFKKNGVIVLTTRPVDLFQAEREALQVAQALRRRARRRVTSPRRKNFYGKLI